MDATGKIVLYVVLAIIVLGGIITFSVFSMSGGREYKDGEGAPRSEEQAQEQEPSKSVLNVIGNFFKGTPKDNYGSRVGRKRSRSSKQRNHRKQ